MPYRAIEVAERAELLRDLRSDDTGEVLAYCALVLEALERRALEQSHLGTTAPDSDRITVTEAALRVGVRRNTIYAAISRGRIAGPGVAGPGVSWREVQAWAFNRRDAKGTKGEP